MADHDPVGTRNIDVRDSPEFQALRRSFMSFILPLCVLFLLWYLAYVVIAGFFPGFFAISVVGSINVGLLFGLGQFVTTFVITMMYRRWADRTYDPQATALRENVEGAAS